MCWAVKCLCVEKYNHGNRRVPNKDESTLRNRSKELNGVLGTTQNKNAQVFQKSWSYSITAEATHLLGRNSFFWAWAAFLWSAGTYFPRRSNVLLGWEHPLGPGVSKGFSAHIPDMSKPSLAQKSCPDFQCSLSVPLGLRKCAKWGLVGKTEAEVRRRNRSGSNRCNDTTGLDLVSCCTEEFCWK